MSGCLAWGGLTVGWLGGLLLITVHLLLRVDPFGFYSLTSIGLIVLGSGALLAGALARFGSLAATGGALAVPASLVVAVVLLGDDGFAWWLLIAPLLLGLTALIALPRQAWLGAGYLLLALALVLVIGPRWADAREDRGEREGSPTAAAREGQVALAPGRARQ